jgi:mono/diheme cytochrome c family protein
MKSIINFGFGLLLALLIVVGYGFKDSTVKITRSDYQPIKKDVKITGSQLFQNNCAACHGVNRQGNPPAFPSLVNIDQKLNKGKISKLLKTGRNTMPSFSHLSESERNAIVAFLYGEDIEADIVTEVSPVQNGMNLFVANCAQCHQPSPENALTGQRRGWGMTPPNLNGVSDWINMTQFKRILDRGPCYMPSFVAMADKDKEDIYAYISTLENNYQNSNYRNRMGRGCSCGMCRSR